jgi:hypothetical protein
MNIIKKIIAFFKKIGILKVGGKVNAYKSSKDKGYEPPDPLD